MLDEAERQMYKQKLRVELQQLKKREQLYIAKRNELKELELAYRKSQMSQV